jgi:hypothetical protein
MNKKLFNRPAIGLWLIPLTKLHQQPGSQGPFNTGINFRSAHAQLVGQLHITPWALADRNQFKYNNNVLWF